MFSGQDLLVSDVVFLVLPQPCGLVWISSFPVLTRFAKQAECCACEALETNHAVGLFRSQGIFFHPKFLGGIFPVLSCPPRNHKKHGVVFTLNSPNPCDHSSDDLCIYSCNTLLNIYLFYVYIIIILAFSRSLCEGSTCLETVFFILFLF